MTRDEFLAWRDDPVTQWVLSAFGAEAEGIRNAWIDGAWDANFLDPVQKAVAHTRWDILSHVSAIDYETACAYAGQEERDEA